MKQLSQQSLDTLLQKHPDELDGVIYDFGYNPPRTAEERSIALRQFLDLEGEPAEKALLKILSPEDCFCGCGMINYTGEMQAEEPAREATTDGPKPDDPVADARTLERYSAAAMRWRTTALICGTVAFMLLVKSLLGNG